MDERPIEQALTESDRPPHLAARACVRLLRFVRGDALCLWPGSPWRDPLLAPALLWLALLEGGFAPTAADAGPGMAAHPRLRELSGALTAAREGRAVTLVGRGLAWSFGHSAWRPEELDRALGAARALERGGTFATRRDLAERASAWNGGSARAIAGRWAQHPPWSERVRRALAPPDAGPLEAVPVGAGVLEPPEELGASAPREDLVRRLDAALTADRLARWTAAPAAELGRGRLPLPIDELAREGLTAVDLSERPDDERWAAVVASQVGWIRGYCARAWPAVRAAGPWRGRAVALWLAGVERCLDRVERVRFRTPARPVAPPRASWSGLVRLAGPEDYRGLG